MNQPFGYRDGWEHLADEQKRLDVRIEIMMRQQAQPAADDMLAPFHGLVVSEEEMWTLLRAGEDDEESDPELLELLALLREASEEIAERVQATRREGTFLPFLHLAEAFELSPLEEQCLLIGLAAECDRKYERMFGFLLDDVTQKQPTVDLVMRLLRLTPPERLAARTVFAPRGKLFTCLLEAGENAEHALPLLARPVRVAERMVRFVLERTEQDEELQRFVEYVHPEQPLPELAWEEDVQARIRRYGVGGRPVFNVQGPPGAGKELQARHYARFVGQPLLAVDLRRVFESDLTFRTLARRVVREAVLHGAVLAFRHADLVLGAESDPKRAEPLWEALDLYRGPLFFLAEQPCKAPGWRERLEAVDVELSAPPDGVRKRIWQALAASAPFAEGMDFGEAAGKFRFTVGQMERALAAAERMRRWKGAEAIAPETLYEACYSQVQHRLEKKATRIVPKLSFEDLVLPDEQKELLRSACRQMKHRAVVYGDWGFEKRLSYGRGLSLLFAGPPGTGKTMAAEVVAKELHLEIYKIDLSQVISKYIGETEKHLQEIFAEAQLSSAILFFDEADALFGKRSEVQDAHDKYANVETSYLLQKMEEYQGISVLATNFQQNIDEAFMRRISYVVQFPFPDAAYREQIWRGMFPPEAPLDADLDFQLVAERFAVAGGNIKNIAVVAAFLAAEEGAPIAMRHLAQAIRQELQKTGKLLLKQELEEYFEL